MTKNTCEFWFHLCISQRNLCQPSFLEPLPVLSLAESLVLPLSESKPGFKFLWMSDIYPAYAQQGLGLLIKSEKFPSTHPLN